MPKPKLNKEKGKEVRKQNVNKHYYEWMYGMQRNPDNNNELLFSVKNNKGNRIYYKYVINEGQWYTRNSDWMKMVRKPACLVKKEDYKNIMPPTNRNYEKVRKPKEPKEKKEKRKRRTAADENDARGKLLQKWYDVKDYVERNYKNKPKELWNAPTFYDWMKEIPGSNNDEKIKNYAKLSGDRLHELRSYAIYLSYPTLKRAEIKKAFNKLGEKDFVKWFHNQFEGEGRDKAKLLKKCEKFIENTKPEKPKEKQKEKPKIKIIKLDRNRTIELKR